MSFTEKPFEDFGQKNKNVRSVDQTTPWHTRSLNATFEDGGCNQDKKPWERMNKSIQIETVRNMQHLN